MHLEDSDDEKVLPKKVKLPINLILSEGNKYLRLLMFHKAIFFFEQILEDNFNNIKALLGRAKCYMRLGMYKEAWHDFQHVIEINPKCTEAMYLKGVTEYLNGNFEKGFITYWESHKKMSACDRLRQGYGMCHTAIENTLDVALKLTEEDIAELSQISVSKEIKLKKKGIYDKSYDRNGMFSTDLKLLEDISKDRDSASIHTLSKDLFEYLRERQKFWKMQNPKQIRGKFHTTQAKKGKIGNLRMENRFNCQLERCKSALVDGETGTCIKEASDLLEKLRKVPHEQFSEKGKMEADALHFLGLSYLMEGNLAASYANCKKQLSIASNKKMPTIEGRALRDMGEVCLKSKKYEKAITYFRQSLKFVTSEKKEAILLYKISDCSTHLGNLGNARSVAEKCLDFAIQSEDPRFRFDVVLLLAEISINGKNMEDAEQYYKKALEIAIQSHDPRKDDVENILQKFEEVYGKKFCSAERLKMVKLTDNIKRNTIL